MEPASSPNLVTSKCTICDTKLDSECSVMYKRIEINSNNMTFNTLCKRFNLVLPKNFRRSSVKQNQKSANMNNTLKFCGQCTELILQIDEMCNEIESLKRSIELLKKTLKKKVVSAKLSSRRLKKRRQANDENDSSEHTNNNNNNNTDLNIQTETIRDLLSEVYVRLPKLNPKDSYRVHHQIDESNESKNSPDLLSALGAVRLPSNLVITPLEAENINSEETTTTNTADIKISLCSLSQGNEDELEGIHAAISNFDNSLISNSSAQEILKPNELTRRWHAMSFEDDTTAETNADMETNNESDYEVNDDVLSPNPVEHGSPAWSPEQDSSKDVDTDQESRLEHPRRRGRMRGKPTYTDDIGDEDFDDDDDADIQILPSSSSFSYAKVKKTKNKNKSGTPSRRRRKLGEPAGKPGRPKKERKPEEEPERKPTRDKLKVDITDDGRIWYRGIEIVQVDDGFRCSICLEKKFFKLRISAVLHVIKNHMEKTEWFTCTHEGCTKQFLHQSNLKSHLKVHSTDKTHMCDVCGMCFKLRETLAGHRRTHDDLCQKNFGCQYCDKKFLHMRDLTVHTRTHTKERPFQCHICPKSFIVLTLLNTHLRSHTGQYDHKCNICSKFFPCSSKLKKHMSSCQKRISTGFMDPQDTAETSTSLTTETVLVDKRFQSTSNEVPHSHVDRAFEKEFCVTELFHAYGVNDQQAADFRSQNKTTTVCTDVRFI